MQVFEVSFPKFRERQPLVLFNAAKVLQRGPWRYRYSIRDHDLRNMAHDPFVSMWGNRWLHPYLSVTPHIFVVFVFGP